VVRKRWRVAERDRASDEALAAEIRKSPVLASLLRRRGVGDAAAARSFLSPRLADLHDPFELPDMERAVARIEEAVQKKEPIAIFGDYDVDGVSSTCLLRDFFNFLGHPVRHRLPNRLLEGYGLRAESLRSLAAEGVRLVITVDNGSSAYEEVEVARSLGLDVVITDHHHPPPELPRAAAFVNPLAPESRYPFRGLAGVGVTFKLVWALSQRFSKQKKVSEEFRTFLVESLALVALGTISDVVPLVGENRVLAKFGLQALEKTRRPGLRKLVECALDLDGGGRLNAGHVGFRLGPRINAAGRLGKAEAAIDLLLAREEKDALVLAEALETANRRRQEIEREMLVTARELVQSTVDLSSDRAIVLGRSEWHAGVIGIVAAKIAEEFSRPTLLISLEKGRARGSARSVPGVHICEALAACGHLLDGFGGHAMAAGVEMDPTRVDLLRAALNRAILRDPAEMAPETEVDAEVRLSDLTLETLAELALLEPHGHGNPEPTFISRNVTVAGEPRTMGDRGQHLSFYARQDRTVARAVAFGRGAEAEPLRRNGAQVTLVYRPRLSRWQGSQELELHVLDFVEE